jgi:hypothetical protein
MMTNSKSVVWPATLQSQLTAHMQAVEHPETPTFPPLGDSRRSCYTLLRDSFDRMNSRLSLQDDQRDYNEMTFSFLIQLLEDCCQKCFLSSRERERLKALLTGSRRHPGVVRKRRDDENILLDGTEKIHFALHLPAEYLLRFLAALPLLIDSFLNFCGGSGMDKALLQGLWERVQLILKDVDAPGLYYSPVTEYQP